MKLRELFEQSNKTAVVAFGRMNPPTIGHAKLVEAIKSHKGDHFVFLSHTQKPKTDPLPYNIKSQFVKSAFPDIQVGDENVRTIIQVLQKLEEMGYTEVVYVAGSDRVNSFEELLNKYDGADYNFENIKVVSAGERDPDAEGAEGMSASKMRAAAASGDKEAFAQGLPERLQPDWENVYSAVRTGMGIKELEPTESAVSESTIDGALKFFIDFHKKYKGDIQKNLWRVSRITDTDYKKLERELHDKIKMGRLPSKFAFRKDLVKQEGA